MSEKIVDLLKSEYQKRMAKNPRYSLRAFAKFLGIEHSALSKILSKKRPLTFELANRLLTALKVQTSTKNSLLLGMAEPSNHADAKAESDFVILSEDELAMSFEWHFYGLLSALEIESVKPTVAGLAKFLNLDLKTTESAINTGIKLGAIKKAGTEFKLTGIMFTTANEVKSESLVKAHVDHIDQALNYLRSTTQKSDYTGVTIAIPLQKLDEAKRRIKEFRRSLASWLNQDDMDKTDVYRLNIQLFPLGKGKV